RTRDVARAAADVDRTLPRPEHGRGNRPRDGARDDVGRVREAIQEVAALEIRTERLNGVAVGRSVRRGDGVEALGVRLVVQAEHGAARQIRALRLDLLARLARARQQVEDRDAVDDREDAAVAAEDAVVNLLGRAAMEQRLDEREPSATVRAAEELERVNPHAAIRPGARGWARRPRRAAS